MAALITVSEANELLGLSEGDGVTQVLCDVACEAVSEYLGPWYEIAERTQVVAGTGSHALILKAYPVTAVCSVTMAGTVVTGWRLDEENGILYRDAGWPPLPDGYTVTYTGGREIPKSIKLACALTVRSLMDALENSGQKLASEAIGDYRATFATISTEGLTSICPVAAMLLRPYRPTHI